MLVVVAVAVGALVFALASIRPVSAVTGATQVATLDRPVAPPEELLAWFGGNEVSAYPFHGLTVARSTQSVFSASEGGEGAQCIIVVADQDISSDGSVRGSLYSECSASDFSAAVQFVVSETSPPELRDAFPIGTPLQFVLDREVVGVFAGEVSPTGAATPGGATLGAATAADADPPAR